jgi:hypothetical protein
MRSPRRSRVEAAQDKAVAALGALEAGEHDVPFEPERRIEIDAFADDEESVAAVLRLTQERRVIERADAAVSTRLPSLGTDQ